MKGMLFILMFILLSLNVFGSVCYVNQPCYIYHEVNAIEFDEVNIQIENKFNITIVNTDMTLFFNKTYEYISTFQDLGLFQINITELNDSVVLNSFLASVTIVEQTNFTDEIRNNNTIFIIVLVLLILIGILGVALNIPPMVFMACFGGLLLSMRMFTLFSDYSWIGVFTGLTSVVLLLYYSFR